MPDASRGVYQFTTPNYNITFFHYSVRTLVATMEVMSIHSFFIVVINF
jgi:hypothetical protein